MATISEVKTKKGIKYRAQIRKRRADGTAFSDTRTFSSRKLAEAWAKRREAEIELDPNIIDANHKMSKMTLSDAIKQYKSEVTNYARTKASTLDMLASFPIASQPLTSLTRVHFTAHATLRLKQRNGKLSKATLVQDFIYIRGVLNRAELAWGVDVDNVLNELSKATKAMRNDRIIGKSLKRTRLPTSDELQRLTDYFVAMWSRGRSNYPMHLIMWFAIYTCRRQGELTRLRIDDFNPKNNTMWARNLKNPDCSLGNDKQFILNEDALHVLNIILSEEVRLRMCSGKYIEDGRLLPISDDYISALWTRACKMLCIDDLRFHDLRHEGATRLAEDGKTIPQIQQVTLHDSWSSLQRYVNVTHRNDRLDFASAVNIAKMLD